MVLNVADMEKIDDYTVALHTPFPDSLLPYEIAGYYQVSSAPWRRRTTTTGVRQAPYGNVPRVRQARAA